MPESIPLMVRTSATSRGFTNSNESTILLEEEEAIQLISPVTVEGHPWDHAHQAITENPAYSFAEPDVVAAEDFYKYQESFEERGDAAREDYYKFLDHWSSPPRPSIWHLGDDFSQLKKAREKVAALPDKKIVRIAHFDTGYSSQHISFPSIENMVRKDLQRNFVDGEEANWNDAEDKYDKGTLKMPGHGAGTLSILAGNKITINDFEFDDYIGLYDSIEIVPIRIAQSVVLLKSGAFVRAMDYVINELCQQEDSRIHVITMSMGGVGSGAWADMVNAAYEKGIFIVTAAGNNFKKLPTRTLIYPARFNRVVAACGVTYNLSPYSKPRGAGSFSVMEGNYGPQSLMNTAIAAFTPNVPWATYRFNDVVGIRGDGTSSATPQIASAAALYYVKNYTALEALPEPWMRVEAIRKALFESASKEINDEDGNFDKDYKKYYGNGILKAAAMLDVPVADADGLVKQPKDKVFLPFFKVLLGLKAAEEATGTREDDMLEIELMQLLLTDEALQNIMEQEEKTFDMLSKEEKIAFATTVLNNPKASETLKERMQLLISQLALS